MYFSYNVDVQLLRHFAGDAVGLQFQSVDLFRGDATGTVAIATVISSSSYQKEMEEIPLDRPKKLQELKEAGALIESGFTKAKAGHLKQI